MRSTVMAERLSLLWAVDEAHLAVVETLVAAGADINRRCQERSASPLHDAASSGHDEMVSLLLKKGAERMQLTRSGRRR